MTHRRALALIAALSAGLAVGYHTGTTDSPSIPRCHSDGTYPLCYTVRVTDGTIIVIDDHDQVVS